jgi:hypothetical protein
VVLKKQPLTYNASFLEFAHHYGFEIRLCNIRAGNEKGRVERAIRTIRESFLNTADHHQSLRALNSALSEWLTDKNTKLHRGTGKIPLDLKNQEKLKPLPIGPWLNRLVHPPKIPTKTGFILFDTNQYSVPEYLIGQPLAVHALCEKIEIYDSQSKLIATHPRSFERNKIHLNPLHRSFSRVSSQTKAVRIFTVIKNIDPIIERFLLLNEALGDNQQQTAAILFTLIRTHARQTVISAVRQAVHQNTPRIQFVSSLLHGGDTAPAEVVRPLNKELLSIDYSPRSLKDYDTHE